jgi:peptidylprolyl isomerase domain and WD repeat-containing protein 1
VNNLKLHQINLLIEAEYTALYLKMLPSASQYEISFLHRDVVTHVQWTPQTNFLMTGSQDGHVKLWKKNPKGIEFVKHFRAHLAPLTGLAVSCDGKFAATTSADKTLKVFDILNFGKVPHLLLFTK